MAVGKQNVGLSELRLPLRRCRGLILAAFLFGVVVNVLMFASPLYMLQVYDRVLGSKSESTLVALSLLMLVLFAGMGVLDNARSKLMSLVGARFQEALDRRVFASAMRRSAVLPGDPIAATAQRDLEAVRIFLASSVFLALMDLPWVPLFIAALFVFHPMLGWLSIVGGSVLVAVTIANQILSRGPQNLANIASIFSDRTTEQLKTEAEALQGLGMFRSGFDRWQLARVNALAKGVAASSLAGSFSSLTKTFRLFLQSAMLGLGAWLVLQGELSAGAMMAGSILMGRALAPIEAAVGQWAIAQRAHEGWRRLAELLSSIPPEEPRTELPRPKAHVEVEALSVARPGEQSLLLRSVSFYVEPGQALGVIGPSGAGKSSLAKALTGFLRPSGGRIRLDGASLNQYDPDTLGRLIGYLPQRITLFDGTIAENIARLDIEPDSDQIIDAARKADAHEMIVRLPQGYDTRVSVAGSKLSGGQIQRIGLARALYGDPVLLILDEPNSNLDNAGSMALNAAVRAFKAEGKSVLIMAHRPAAIQECDMILVLEDGVRKIFGPRDQVLRDQVRNHTEVLKPVAPGVAP